jgi:trk system potassium uptake protein TrkA
MKYIVIGLGLFGSKCASILTTMGNEVMGIDYKEEILEEYKESFTSIIKMDTTNINAVKTLPLNDVDAVIVAIGEDVGASILTLSILKNLHVKRIIGRAINPVHHNILTQIGIEEVVLPLEDSASQLASLLQLKGALGLNMINNDHAIAEVRIPDHFVGHLPETIDLEERFKIKVIAIKHPPKEGLISTVFRRDYRVDLFYDLNTPFTESDILVIAGKVSSIRSFMES